MHSATANLFTRDDTFFGVCEGLGEDFRIHPNILRVMFGGLLFWNPPLALGIYAAAGALVALTRWLVPNPRPAAEAEGEQPEAVAEAPVGSNQPAEAGTAEAEQIPLAA